MKSLLLLLVCALTLSGCASMQPQVKLPPDRNRVARDLADEKLDQAMRDLLAPTPAPLVIAGQAVAMDASSTSR